MSYLDWKVGDKVVCVDSDWTDVILIDGVALNLPHREPMDGEVLTIASMQAGIGAYGSGRPDGVYLEFEEIQLRQEDCGVSFELRWDARHFRKVQSRKTDISVFTAMLHSQRDKVQA